jgi:Flp pilus assembly protein TadG
MPGSGQIRLLPLVRRLRRDQSGAALLEMTVVMPFLLFLGFGLFEFSNALYQYHVITVGVREAARFAAGLPIPDPVVQDEACANPQVTPVGCAKRVAVTGEIDGDTLKVDWWDTDDITITYPSVENTDLGGGLSSYRGGTEITVVRVSTTATYSGLGFLTTLGLEPFTITTGHEERHYGVR